MTQRGVRNGSWPDGAASNLQPDVGKRLGSAEKQRKKKETKAKRGNRDLLQFISGIDLREIQAGRY